MAKSHIQNAQKFSELLGNRGIPYNINLKHYTKTCLELRLNSCRSPELRCPSLFSKCLVLELKSKSPMLTWWRFPSSLLLFLLRFIHPPHASLHQRCNKTKSQCSQHGTAQQEWRNGVNITTEKTCQNSGCDSLVSNCVHWCVRATDRLCNLQENVRHILWGKDHRIDARLTNRFSQYQLPASHLAVTSATVHTRGSHDFSRSSNGVLSSFLLCLLDLDRLSSRMEEPERILANNSLDTANFIVRLSSCCGRPAWRWGHEEEVVESLLLFDSLLGTGRRKYVSPGVRIVSGGKILPSCMSKRELEWQTKWPGYPWSKTATRIGL